MQTVGAFDAKTHFSQILAAVTKGEKFIITKRDRKIAMIIPITETDAIQDSVAAAIASIRTTRKGVKLGKNLTIKKMINEGRR